MGMGLPEAITILTGAEERAPSLSRITIEVTLVGDRVHVFECDEVPVGPAVHTHLRDALERLDPRCRDCSFYWQVTAAVNTTYPNAVLRALRDMNTLFDALGAPLDPPSASRDDVDRWAEHVGQLFESVSSDVFQMAVSQGDCPLSDYYGVLGARGDEALRRVGRSLLADLGSDSAPGLQDHTVLAALSPSIPAMALHVPQLFTDFGHRAALLRAIEVPTSSNHSVTLVHGARPLVEHVAGSRQWLHRELVDLEPGGALTDHDVEAVAALYNPREKASACGTLERTLEIALSL